MVRCQERRGIQEGTDHQALQGTQQVGSRQGGRGIQVVLCDG